MPLGTQISSSAPSINGTESFDHEIANTEKNNKILKNMLQHVSNSKIENGYLRADKNNMLFLKKELTPGTLMAKLHIIKQEQSKYIKTLELDLHLGQKIRREDLISHLKNTITTNDLHIENCKKGKDELFEIRKDPIAESPNTEAAEHPGTNNKKISDVTAVSPIAGLRDEQKKAEELKEKLLSLKENFNSQNNQPDKGTLRYSEEKGLYLSKNFSIREALELHDAGAAEFKKTFDDIDLGFGKATDPKSVSSKIEEKLNFQNKHIEFLKDRIKDKEKQLSAQQPSMNGGIPDAFPVRQETASIAHNTDRISGDDLDEWSEISQEKASLHSLILNHLNSSSTNLSIDDIELDDLIKPGNPVPNANGNKVSETYSSAESSRISQFGFDDSDVPEYPAPPPPNAHKPDASSPVKINPESASTSTSTSEQLNNRPKNLPIDDTNPDAIVKSSNRPTSPERTIFFDKEGNSIKIRDFDEKGRPIPLKRTHSLTKETPQADSLQDSVDQPFDFEATRNFFENRK